MHRNQRDASVFGVLGLAVVALVSFSLAGCSDKDEAAEKKKQAEQQLGQAPALRSPGNRDVMPTPVPPIKGVAVPSFDVVRVDRNGEGVIAGRAEPGWKVVIEANGRRLATVTTDRDGEWAVVLEKPLESGDHTLGLKAYAPDGTRGLVSDQTIVVAVASASGEETVVALAAPGRPTRVMRAPQIASATETRQQAVAQPRDVVRSGSLTARAPASTAAGDRSARAGQVVAAATGDTGARQAVTSDTDGRRLAAAAASAPGAVVSGIAGPGTVSGNGPLAAAEAGGPAPQAGSDRVAALQQRAAAGAAPSAAPAGRIKTRAFRAAPLTAEPDRTGGGASRGSAAIRPDAEPSVAFEAVDYEDTGSGESRVFITGSAKAGAKLFIYIDDEPVGEARAKQDGRWVFSGPIALRPGAHRMRADQVTGGGRVVARAEVTFERLTTAALAEAQAQTGQGETQAGLAAPGSSAQSPAAGGTPTTAVAAATPGAAQPGPQAAPKKARGTTRKRRSRRARSVVVRRGDSLWRIARRYYGRGARYTTIYRRNRHQIRNPDLIYPRQRLRIR